MENIHLSGQGILCQLRQNQRNKDDSPITNFLDHIELHVCQGDCQHYEILEELIQLLPIGTICTLEATDDVLSCVILLTYLQEQQKLPCLNEVQFQKMWQWLLDQHKCDRNCIDTVCKIIIAIGNLFSMHFEYANNYIVWVIQTLINNISANTANVVLIATMQSLIKILSILREVSLSNEQSTVCAQAGINLLQLYYCNPETIVEAYYVSIIILYTFQILHKIIALNSDFAYQYTGELLGLSIAYLHFGINAPEVVLIKPQKVYPSQQMLYDSASGIESVMKFEETQNCCGKTRKPRKSRAKNLRSNDCKVATNLSAENQCRTLVFDTKASDSDVSEADNASSYILFVRNRRASVRLASISLVGSIVQILDIKTIYGYWHALLPSGTAASKVNLLYVGQYDPNLRCRCMALQVCAHLFYGSKGYLRQAEINVKRCPTTFIPFSVSLGYTVLAIYKSITAILSSESSLPVLIQTLKCLAVLVQASTFKQFKNGLVMDFVKNVKPLVYHQDASIQVSALMVMEFLIALPETTCDIAEAIGIPLEVAKDRGTYVQNKDDEEINIEEFVESERNISMVEKTGDLKKRSFPNAKNIEGASWLLKRVFHNLNQQDKMQPSSVRIESLQVLIAMSSRFAIIKHHLIELSDVLLFTLTDILPDVRLYAARCIDACTYQISHYFLDNAFFTESEIRECNKFWLNIIPFIMYQIRRDSEEVVTIRTTLCNSLSNIGTLMFEHTPHSSQIRLLSFLSGVCGDITEEATVRSSAARALGIFALYPSLRDDLVFIENTAELALCLINDSNLLVRVKSCWSLGNISDALFDKEVEISQLTQKRISDDLLFRLITAVTTACSDSDKVRCNAVRALGNLLCLLNDKHFNNDNKKINFRQVFAKSICKLSDCIRSPGNAKVKWNACHIISNLMRNPIIFKLSDLSWQDIIFPDLCHVIVHHPNFKVRINALPAITNITERTYFGRYYETCWSSILKSIDQSYNLDNFHEYKHRDNLQEKLCLALSHIIRLAVNDDLAMLKKHILQHTEIIRSTWKRVINRVLPEKAAPLLSCPIVLKQRVKHQEDFSLEQTNIIYFLIEILSTE